MLKKELTLAALAAAMLTLGTATTANAQVDCYSACMEYPGPGFYSPTYFFDDKGNLGEPGEYGYIGCYEDGDGTWCVYQNLE